MKSSVQVRYIIRQKRNFIICKITLKILMTIYDVLLQSLIKLVIVIVRSMFNITINCVNL